MPSLPGVNPRDAWEEGYMIAFSVQSIIQMLSVYHKVMEIKRGAGEERERGEESLLAMRK